MRRPALASLRVAAVALVLVGCGGRTPTTGKPLTKQEFMTVANAACKEASDRLTTLVAPTDLPSVASYAASVEPIFQDLLRKLQQLRPPDQERAAVDHLLNSLNADEAKVPELRAAAEAGDLTKVRKIVNDVKASPVDTQASDLGLAECAKSSQASG